MTNGMLDKEVNEILSDENFSKEQKTAKIIALVKSQNKITELLLEQEEQSADILVSRRTKKDESTVYESRKFGWT